MKKSLLILGSITIFATNMLYAQDFVKSKTINEKGNINLITFSEGSNLSKSNTQNILKDVLKLSDESSMKKVNEVRYNSDFVTEKFAHYINGIRVEGSTYNVNYKGDKLISMSGEVFTTNDIISKPQISESNAFASALKKVNAQRYMWENAAYSAKTGYTKPKAELVYLPVETLGQMSKLILAYKFDIYAAKPMSRGYVYIDATSGDFVSYNAIMKHAHSKSESNDLIATNRNQATTSKIEIPESYKATSLELGNAATRYSGARQIETKLVNGQYILASESRKVYTKNSNKTDDIESATEFVDNDNNWTAAEFDNSNFDNAALDAHWGVSNTYDYFKSTFNRDSFDNAGAEINSYVHFYEKLENAAWSGAEMVYGDGDVYFKPLTAFDVTAHELGHAVCQYTANLAYEREHGAINEGLSDIWAAIIEHKYAPEKQPFLIGEDITNVAPGFIRSMSNPKSATLSKQPDTYKGQYWQPATKAEGCTIPSEEANDYCGVHTNSGVLNHWFYILVSGKTGTNDVGSSYNVTGIGWEKAANIVYRLESSFLTEFSTYKNTRDFAIQAAKELYGDTSAEAIAVQDAFYAVGVGTKHLTTPDTQAPTTPTNLVASNVKATTATLTWAGSTDNEKVEGYIVYGNNEELARTTELTVDLFGLTVNTDYNMTVKAYDDANNLSAASNIVSFKTAASLQYCTAKSLNATEENIGRVVLNTLDKSSTGTAGYEDFSNLSTDLVVGETYQLEIHPLFPQGGSSAETYGAYIDWNNDGSFSGANEMIGGSGLPTFNKPFKIPFTVPSSAIKNQKLRMRLVLQYAGFGTDPCRTFDYGQVEDYSVKVTSNLGTIDTTASTTTIYPNPTKDSINIQTGQSTTYDQFEIVNAAGQIIKTGKLSGSIIDVKALPVGQYILKLTGKDASSVHKFIKN
ncbi:Por secretion system C-terminal sorting domain-containing protein [Soonwooa buanensis]|uniref:Por secretion system C-terminal sorting domain-containing protein n=1 Tax=Soonwooa buanensis TaxID=619805 RepID=A0A1T5FVL2_9FLAO|nr:M4 family metallopeptidase [Soonwooa buanensis]SKC00225.1 Por secretion system C-terminal sorting domain-containing protein [Soonwooa buanensis]